METKNTPGEESKLAPCEHMTDYLSALSDGSLKGPAYWFTKFHLLHCGKCSRALRGFEALRTRLLGMGRAAQKNGTAALNTETRSALQKALDELDEKHA